MLLKDAEPRTVQRLVEYLHYRRRLVYRDSHSLLYWLNFIRSNHRGHLAQHISSQIGRGQ